MRKVRFGFIVAMLALVFSSACGGTTSPTSPSPVEPGPNPGPAPLPTPAMQPGVHYGSDITASDRGDIDLAFSLSEGFWGGSSISVFAYSTIDSVLAAYVEACRCSPPLDSRRSLESGFEATAPNVLMVWVANAFHAFNPETRIGALIHTMHHAMQRGFTNGFIGPVWMIEGGAEYATVHGVRSIEAHHQFLRDEARSLNFTLAELETYGSNDGFTHPFGRAPYCLGHFATDLLVSRRGRSAILEYWRTLGSNLARGINSDAAWRAAFQSVFGISVVDFYADFEAYRSRGFQ